MEQPRKKQNRKKNNNKKTRTNVTRVVSEGEYEKNSAMLLPAIPRNPKLTEQRYIDTVINMTPVASWIIVDIMAIPQGILSTTRIGSIVQPCSVEWSFQVATQNADVYTAVRWIILTWMPQSANQPLTMASVMQVNNDINSFYQFEAASEYRIVRDKFLAMSGIAAAPTTSGYVTENGSIARLIHPESIFAAGGTSGTRKLFFVCMSNSSLVPFPDLIGRIRVTFWT